MKKQVIYMAGDSTMQSYDDEKRPQAGWGERLCRYLEGREAQKTWHRMDCPFEQELCYEGSSFIVDNCAMAGRSSKTFLEEGRLRDIENHIGAGDYLLIQFGHNDASDVKPERYVPVRQFDEFLMKYIRAANRHGAVPVLISSIALCPCEDNEKGEKGRILKRLPDYAKVMEEVAKRELLEYVDMQSQTRDYCGKTEERVLGEIYKEDHVHLTVTGADVYAKLAAEKLKKVIKAEV